MWKIFCILIKRLIVLVPRLDLASLESGYHGLVKENETLVEVTPRIKAIGAEICSFRIVNKHHGEAPFEVGLISHNMFYPLEITLYAVMAQLNMYDCCNSIVNVNSVDYVAFVFVFIFALQHLQL